MRYTMALLALLLLIGGCGEADSELESTVAEGPTDETGLETGEGGESETGDGGELPATTAAPLPTTTAPVAERAEPAPENPERVAPTGDEAVIGEVPDSLIEQIRGDVTARSGIAAAEVTVVRAEEAVWNDGSLGCPEPGEFYTQALVSGFWVVLEAGGAEYDYRANDKGFFKLCRDGGQPPSNPVG